MCISFRYKSPFPHDFWASLVRVKGKRVYKVCYTDEVGTRRNKVGYPQILEEYEALL